MKQDNTFLGIMLGWGIRQFKNLKSLYDYGQRFYLSGLCLFTECARRTSSLPFSETIISGMKWVNFVPQTMDHGERKNACLTLM